MALTFRKAVPSEHDDARRVLWTAFTPYVRNLGREITAHHYTFLAAAIARGDVYLALDGEEIVGVAATERRDSGIYTDAPEHRAREFPAGANRGDSARASGFNELSLETAEMAEGNVRLYRRHGFEIVRRGPPSHGMDAHTRVFMVKPLSGSRRRDSG